MESRQEIWKGSEGKNHIPPEAQPGQGLDIIPNAQVA